MNQRQKEILQSQLNNEKKTIKELQQVYAQASKDIEKKIRKLSARTDMENLQSIIYQKQYQDVLKKQVDATLEMLHSNEFTTIQDYLAKSYNDGFLGTMYDIAGQGIPLIIPIDTKQVIQAIQTDSKISTNLYTRLGEDIKYLKNSIRAELSRGISQGYTWNDIAVNIAKGMKSDKEKAYNNAIRIARTEGHRIQTKATSDAQYKAKEKGADIVKQWDSSIDKRTRPSHARVDGEIRELDEKFSNGLEYPGDPKGKAEDVVNCRCALLQRAKWALDDEELETLKERAEYFGLDKAKNFDEYKSKYLKATENIEKNPKSGKIEFKEAITIEEAKQYAKNVLNINYENMDKVNIDCANMINREITNIYNVFGDINSEGYLSGVRLYPKKSDWVAAYSPSFKEIFVKNVTAKNSLSKMAKEAKEQFNFGFWSDKSTEHAIRHEAGHAIQHMLTDNDSVKLNKISVLRNQIIKDCGISSWSVNDTEEHMKSAGSVISYYALRNDGEFIAESVAEYMAGNPRKTAKKVVKILLEGR